MSHKIMARRCNQCLYGKNKIVSDASRRDIIRKCDMKDVSFLCHKGTLAGQDIDCQGYHQATNGGGKVARFAAWLGVVQWIDPDTLQPVTPGAETANEGA